MGFYGVHPLVKVCIAMGRSTMFNWTTHYFYGQLFWHNQRVIFYSPSLVLLRVGFDVPCYPLSSKAWQRATSINVKPLAPTAHIIAAKWQFSQIEHSGAAIETQMKIRHRSTNLLSWGCCDCCLILYCHVKTRTFCCPIFWQFRTATAWSSKRWKRLHQLLS